MKRKPFEPSRLLMSALGLLSVVLMGYSLFIIAVTFVQPDFNDANELRLAFANIKFALMLLLLGVLAGLLIATLRASQNFQQRKLKTEKALHQSEELLRSVFETVAEGIYIVDQHGRMTFANRGMEQILGMPREQIAQRSFDDEAWQITTAEGEPFPDDEQPYNIVMRTGQPVYDVEQAIARPDGRRIVVSINAAPLLDANGAVIGEVATLSDVTARKRSEQALAEERNLLRHVIENLPYNVFIKDTEGRYVIVNRSHALSLGLSTSADAIGKISYDFYPPRIAAQRREDDQFIVQTGQPILNRERLSRTQDDAERWMLTSKVPLHDTSGRVSGILGISQDISERKQMENDLRKSLATNRALLSAIPDLMFRIRADGTILDYSGGKDWNIALRPEDVINKSIYLVIPRRLARQAMLHVQRALASGETQRFECQMTLDGKVRDFETRVGVCGEGEALAIVRDISERKAADRLKNEFVSTVSHELRTPLTSIRGSLGLVVGGIAGELPPQAKAMIEIAHKNSERLVSLVNDILDIEKIEAGKLVFHFKPLELLPLVEQAIEANRAFGQQFGVRFALHSALPGIRVRADADRLMQVMTNLLSNAAKFSPRDSTVAIRVEPSQRGVRVAIQDRGPGIPEAFRSRIFQKFAQADSSDTRQKGGTGLGLSIAKAIVEKHDGQIGFESEPGAGTTFFFDLPVLPEAARCAPFEAPSTPARNGHPLILICEDDRDVASLLQILLRQGGFQSDVAHSAAQAKALLTRRHYAAMTLDLMLPDADGVSLIRELRQQEATRQLPIIVISAEAEEGRKKLNGDALLVIDWLTKPIDQMRLIEAVRAATNSAAHHRPRILHVEDDPDVLRVVNLILDELADIDHALDVHSARQMLARWPYDLVILDLSLQDASGLALLPDMHQPGRPPIPVVVFSGQELSGGAARQVAAALVKTRASNQDLLHTIALLVQPHGHSGQPTHMAAPSALCLN